MLFIKNLWELIVAIIKMVSALLQSWFRPGEAVRRQLEIERLDRIRHPSKYLGK
jgi:hypothetical protein